MDSPHKLPITSRPTQLQDKAEARDFCPGGVLKVRDSLQGLHPWLQQNKAMNSSTHCVKTSKCSDNDEVLQQEKLDDYKKAGTKHGGHTINITHAPTGHKTKTNEHSKWEIEMQKS